MSTVRPPTDESKSTPIFAVVITLRVQAVGLAVQRGITRERELRGQEQFSVELPRIRAGVEDKLKTPNPADEPFEDVVKLARNATGLVSVY